MTDISRYQLISNDVYRFVIGREVKVVLSTNHKSLNLSTNSFISVDISHSFTCFVIMPSVMPKIN